MLACKQLAVMKEKEQNVSNKIEHKITLDKIKSSHCDLNITDVKYIERIMRECIVLGA